MVINGLERHRKRHHQHACSTHFLVSLEPLTMQHLSSSFKTHPGQPTQSTGTATTTTSSPKLSDIHEALDKVCKSLMHDPKAYLAARKASDEVILAFFEGRMTLDSGAWPHDCQEALEAAGFRFAAGAGHSDPHSHADSGNRKYESDIKGAPDLSGPMIEARFPVAAKLPAEMVRPVEVQLPIEVSLDNFDTHLGVSATKVATTMASNFKSLAALNPVQKALKVTRLIANLIPAIQRLPLQIEQQRLFELLKEHLSPLRNLHQQEVGSAVHAAEREIDLAMNVHSPQGKNLILQARQLPKFAALYLHPESRTLPPAKFPAKLDMTLTALTAAIANHTPPVERLWILNELAASLDGLVGEYPKHLGVISQAFVAHITPSAERHRSRAPADEAAQRRLTVLTNRYRGWAQSHSQDGIVNYIASVFTKKPSLQAPLFNRAVDLVDESTLDTPVKANILEAMFIKLSADALADPDDDMSTLDEVALHALNVVDEHLLDVCPATRTSIEKAQIRFNLTRAGLQ
jgi:hypothetical protein